MKVTHNILPLENACSTGSPVNNICHSLTFWFQYVHISNTEILVSKGQSLHEKLMYRNLITFLFKELCQKTLPQQPEM